MCTLQDTEEVVVASRTWPPHRFAPRPWVFRRRVWLMALCLARTKVDLIQLLRGHLSGFTTLVRQQ
eukprot:1978873-Amphidinium_carterae.1